MILFALIIYTLFRGVPERANVDRLEAQLAGYPIETPQGHEAGRVPEYLRYYADVRPRSARDLPFQHLPRELSVRPGQALIAGVLISPELDGKAARPGVRRVAVRNLPRPALGGCQVVNVLYDPRRDEIVAAWCNPDGAAAAVEAGAQPG